MNRAFFLLFFAFPLGVACSGSPTPPPAPPVSTSTTTTTTDDATAPSPSVSSAPSSGPSSAACAASSESTTTTTATASTGPAWKDMSHAQKLAFMKAVFFPKMKAEFVAFDAKTFDKMSCVTCHGDGAKDGSFKMPSAQLPKLKVDAGFKTEMAKHPAITKFMMEKVAGDAASTLGLSPYDPKTHQGFGCFGCHTPEK